MSFFYIRNSYCQGRSLCLSNDNWKSIELSLIFYKHLSETLIFFLASSVQSFMRITLFTSCMAITLLQHPPVAMILLTIPQKNLIYPPPPTNLCKPPPIILQMNFFFDLPIKESNWPLTNLYIPHNIRTFGPPPLYNVSYPSLKIKHGFLDSDTRHCTQGKKEQTLRMWDKYSIEM